MPTFSRRALILGGACALSAASAFPFFAGANETITVDEFRALSARLTGASLTDLNATAAAKLLDGFLSTGRGADLARLAADPGARAGPLADDIVAAWYSGNYQHSHRPRLDRSPWRASVGRAQFHQAVRLLRRPDRLLGRRASELNPIHGRHRS